MQLGMIGLGRMGANIVRRLMRDNHECVVYDVNAQNVAAMQSEGATGASSLQDLLEAGDIVIDGGNSYYRDDMRRAAELAGRGIHYVDVGTSGGVWGLEQGYCLMIGGDAGVFEHLL